MKRVIIESPCAGDIEKNLEYAGWALRDSLMRGEAPVCFHRLYAQEPVLDDTIPEEREMGMMAAAAWILQCDLAAFYEDFGWSPGMLLAKSKYIKTGIPFVVRRILEPE